MKTLAARLRAWLGTRTGRLVVHDVALAAAAGAAVIEGAHNLDSGVVKAAGIVALKALLRVVLPVPAADNSDPAAQLTQVGQVGVALVSEIVRDGARLGRHVEHDVRSLAYRIAAVDVPIVSKQWRRHGGPFNQGDVGSCTGNAVAGVLNTDPFRKPGRKLLTEKDALAIYTLATQLDAIPGAYPASDTGSSGRAAMAAAKQMGLIDGYNWAFGLKQALAALMAGPAAFGTVWLTGMDAPDARGIVQAVGVARGAHEYEALGVDAVQKLVWFENSWGRTFGSAGRFAMSFADVDRLLRQHGDVVQPTLPTAA